MAPREHDRALRLSSRADANPVLRVEGICAGYGKKQILTDVTLTLGAGELVAVIGPNGAGKSTLLKVVSGLLRPTEGRVVVSGDDVTDRPAYWRARTGVGLLIQGGAVFPSLTPEEHLRLGAAGCRRVPEGSPRTAGDRPLPALLERRRKTAAGLFSGGERQALAVATVLASKPKLLLADEPSAGLAPSAAGALFRELATASREFGLPVLWVEQRVADILPLVDRAVILRNGRAVAETRRPTSWLDGDVLSGLMFGGGQ